MAAAAGGSLTVRVVTTADQPVAGAIVRLTGMAPAATDSSGVWRTADVPPGPATVEVRKSGFRTVRQDLVLSSGGRTTLTVYLAAGSEGDDSAPAAEDHGTEVGQTISGNQMAQLPLGDRRSMNVAGTTGASVFLSYEAGQKASFSLGGGRSRSQVFNVDGGNGQSMRLGSAQMEFDPAVEELAEVRLTASGYSAEYGGSAGGVISARIKSGSDRFSGSLFHFLRNERLDAAGFFAPVEGNEKLKAPLRYNVYGGTLGGPLRKDRAFFFFSYEGSRRIEGAPRRLTVPTALQRNGDFSATVNSQGRLVSIFDPATSRVQGSRTVRDPFPGNIIPGMRFDAVARNLAPMYPAPNQLTATLPGADEFSANSARKFVRDHLTAKVDQRLGDDDRLSIRYIHDVNDQKTRSIFPVAAADNQTDSLSGQHNAFGNWSREFSPSLVNVLRLTYSRRTYHQVSKGIGEDWPAKLGLSGVPQRAFPRFQASGYTALGSPNQERRQFPVEQWQLLDVVRWRRGPHDFRFGFEVRPSRNVEANLQAVSGVFVFSPTGTGQPGQAGTGNSFASLLLGHTNAFTQRETDVLERSSTYLAAFLQNDWRINSRLTVNLGVRWEADTAMSDANGRMNGFGATEVNPVSGTPGVVEFAGREGLPARFYDTDWNNVGPRAGFALRVPGTDTAVLRGGYGVFVGHPFDRGVTTAASLGFELSARLVSPDGGVTPPFLLAQGVPVTPARPELTPAFGAAAPGQIPNTAVTFFERARSTSYAHQYHLGLGRSLAGRATVELSILGNLGRKLAGGNLSINQIRPELMGPGASQALRPFPQYADVQIVAPSLGVSSYHAAMIRVERRFSGGLQFAGSYTWSKLLSNVDGGEQNGGGEATYSDFYNRRADWGASENDIRRRFTWSSTWQLPFGRGGRLLRGGLPALIAGGWGLGSIVTIQSAPPFTVTAQTNTTYAFPAGPLRADVLGDPNLPADVRTLHEWFDTSKFAQPAPYTFGNQGVNILRGDGLVNFDFSILRSFRLRERWNLEFRGEVFNAINHPDFGLPGHSFGSADFGVVDTARPPRRVQLGMRLTF